MKWWDIKKPATAIKMQYYRYLVDKFFASLEYRGGVAGGRYVLFVYNEQSPELSYILTEPI